jgi:hypothetical protein
MVIVNLRIVTPSDCGDMMEYDVEKLNEIGWLNESDSE